jgi:hypothetical protein
MISRIKTRFSRHTSNWGFCPLASAVASIAYRVGCEDAKDIETFNNLCERDYSRCPINKQKIER